MIEIIDFLDEKQIKHSYDANQNIVIEGKIKT